MREYVLPGGGLTGSGLVTTGGVAISPDDKTVFVGAFQDSPPFDPFIDRFDAATARYQGKISIGTFLPSQLVADATGRYVFASSTDPQNVPVLRVYS